MNNRLKTVFTVVKDFVQPEKERKSIQMEEMLVRAAENYEGTLCVDGNKTRWGS